MPLSRLDPDAIKKVSGPSWVPLKQTFLDLSEALLGAGCEASANLTTIYVKYQVSSEPSSSVYAVAWIKTSREIVVGLAFPESEVPPELAPPFAGMRYPGLTGYFVLRHGDQLPAALGEWARRAYRTALEGAKKVD
jgi:hypothetical protein